MSQQDGQWHALLGLIGGIAEHETLIAGAHVLEVLVDVHSLRDIRTLLFQGQQDVAGLVVEALVGRVVADSLNTVTDDSLVVDLGLAGDLATDQDHTGLGKRLCKRQIQPL